MRNLWYKIMRFYMKASLFFLMKKVTVHGKENIPKKGALLFIPNHQNALIDAILVPTTNSRNIHFLTRAAVFQNKKVANFLATLNMLPVYRIRDGINTIEKNLPIFQKCFKILLNKKAIEIFAEGEHHIDRRILPLKKGFARIIEGTLELNPDLEIQIIPVGINYDSHLNYPSSAAIYYGKPIHANPFFDLKKPDLKYSGIINEVSEAMKKLTLHIEYTEEYDQIIKKLEANNVNYLDPIEAYNMLKNIDNLPNSENPKNSKIEWLTPIYLIAKINSILPLLIWNKLKKGITDILFTNTFRLALIAVLFPLFYLIQTSIVYYFFNLKYALIYLLACIILGLITTKTKRVNL